MSRSPKHLVVQVSPCQMVRLKFQQQGNQKRETRNVLDTLKQSTCCKLRHKCDIAAGVPYLRGGFAIISKAQDIFAWDKPSRDFDHVANGNIVAVPNAVRAVRFKCRITTLAVIVAPGAV